MKTISETTTGHAAPFRLLELPAEIRNYIYELALVEDSPIVIDPALKKAQASQPPLIRVSRQIRQETLSLFYSKNTFEFDISSKGYNAEEGHSLWIPASQVSHLTQILVRRCQHEGTYYSLDCTGKLEGFNLVVKNECPTVNYHSNPMIFACSGTNSAPTARAFVACLNWYCRQRVKTTKYYLERFIGST